MPRIEKVESCLTCALVECRYEAQVLTPVPEEELLGADAEELALAGDMLEAELHQVALAEALEEAEPELLAEVAAACAADPTLDGDQVLQERVAAFSVRFAEAWHEQVSEPGDAPDHFPSELTLGQGVEVLYQLGEGNGEGRCTGVCRWAGLEEEIFVEEAVGCRAEVILGLRLGVITQLSAHRCEHWEGIDGPVVAV